MSLTEHRERLVILQDAEQAKTFAAYDDDRYLAINRAIDAVDALLYAQTLPERVDIKGRNMLQLAERRWVRAMHKLDLPVS